MFIVQKIETRQRLKENYFQPLTAKIQEEKMKEWIKRYTSDILINRIARNGKIFTYRFIT